MSSSSTTSCSRSRASRSRRRRSIFTAQTLCARSRACMTSGCRRVSMRSRQCHRDGTQDRKPSMNSPRHYRNGALACAALLIAGCASNPSEEPVPQPVAAPAPAPAPAGKTAPAPAAQSAGDGTAVPVDVNAPPAGPVIPPRAAAQFDQALALLAAGKAQDAELEFKTMIVAYPEFPAPHVNLGLIYLRANKFADAEREFQAALQAA